MPSDTSNNRAFYVPKILNLTQEPLMGIAASNVIVVKFYLC